MAESVKVAVRVRPFNSREKQAESKCCLKMNGTTTIITDPTDSENVKKFAFDFSYWSHDQFHEEADGLLVADSPAYATQKAVFDDLGKGVLDNAWSGYNCSLFAYGQTGAGKSYSMVGYGVNKGIVPITCDSLFKSIEERKGDGTNYRVTLSMLEIYNEQVRDLLSKKAAPKGGLKVRQHPSKGFYVNELTVVPVDSYESIDQKIADGTRNRTVAATQMNATSSRAHTLVTISFSQVTKNDAGQEMNKSSSMNLVDLAGSERADSTGATGDRLKEGSAINQSLSSLGNVISALADKSMGKKNVMVPFRDSTLTKLLQNALGGNSKTIMIAALSPADINFEETLGTLRFADRAKKIKTKATVNENPTEKLIRELKEENERLKKLMGGEVPPPSDAEAGANFTPEAIERMRKEMEEEMRAQMEANMLEMGNMDQDKWNAHLEDSNAGESAKLAAEQELLRKPHLSNLNEDALLSHVVKHVLSEDRIVVGNKKASPAADLVLSGLSIQQSHAVIERKEDSIFITGDAVAKTFVNGEPLVGTKELKHNDRILFGSNNMYVMVHPLDRDQREATGEKEAVVTWEDAQKEIAKSQGFESLSSSGSQSDKLLQEDLIAMLPQMNEVNAMSEELNKKMYFEVVLISPQARGLADGRTEVHIKMKSLVTGHEWMWSRKKFLNRKFLMQEMYQAYSENGKDWDREQEKDPFWEPADSEIVIGHSQVYLQSLAYGIEVDEMLPITDYKGLEVGHIKVEIIPCNADGVLMDEDSDNFVECPEEMIGKPLAFKIKIEYARGIAAKVSKDVFGRYKFYLDTESQLTKATDGPNPDFQFEHLVKVDQATDQFIKYLENEYLTIEVVGHQKESSSDASKAQLTTGQLMMQRNAKLSATAVESSQLDATERYKLHSDRMVIERRLQRQSKKYLAMVALVKKAQKDGADAVPTEALEKILQSTEPRFHGVARMVLAHKTFSTKRADGNKVSEACNLM